MTDWNFDISKAPRGRTVTVMRNTKTKDGVVRLPVKEFENDPVWLASKCGKVVKAYWIPGRNGDGRWAGFANDEAPIAWQEFEVPVHPSLQMEESPW